MLEIKYLEIGEKKVIFPLFGLVLLLDPDPYYQKFNGSGSCKNIRIPPRNIFSEIGIAESPFRLLSSSEI